MSHHPLIPFYGLLTLTVLTMEPDHSIKDGPSKGASISHSSGGKIPSVSPPISYRELFKN